MNAEEMRTRSKQFALRIMKLADSLPRTASGRTLAGQIVRSGTSVAANYRAAGKARSKAEFIAKLGIAEEEADETQFWLELIIESGIVPSTRLEPLLQEARELTAIIAASRISASKRK
jgi:four helix bundle protein